MRPLAFGLAAVTLIANLALQPLLMHLAPAMLIPGLADFYPAWNRGVSFSLFTQNGQTGRIMLILVLTVLSAGLGLAAWRWSTNRLSAIAYGLALGGALGNLADRLRFSGAVFDFLSLHLGSLPLFICNLPDIAISAGFVLLVAESLFARQRAA